MDYIFSVKSIYLIRSLIWFGHILLCNCKINKHVSLFRGDFEDFDIANEDDNLEEFLGIPRKNPKAAPVKTGAVAPEVGRLEPGKLDIKEEKQPKSDENKKVEVEVRDEHLDDNTITEECKEEGDNGGHDDKENETEPNDSINGDTETDSGFKDDTDSVENKSEDGDFETFQNCIKDDSDDEKDENSGHLLF